MEEHGRGAWNNAGKGGTKAYANPEKPGPYYYLGTGSLPTKDSQDNKVVHLAVKAYQRALNRRLGDKYTVVVDGIFGPQTVSAVTRFQSKNPGLVVWGGIGPDTSKYLLLKDLERVVERFSKWEQLSATVVSGLIRHESGWDVGAVGYADPNDVGLAQINGPSHPSMTTAQRVQPINAFKFIINYMNNALAHFDGNLRDAVASYNLGIGGADRWISQGRPDMYTPKGSTKARDVKYYIDTVLQG